MRPGKVRFFLGGLAVVLLPGLLLAQEPQIPDTPRGEPAAAQVVLPPVSVLGTLRNPATGRSVLDRQVIERLPAGNGSINEILRVLPDVQLGEKYRTPEQAGEILPPPVSISGGKTFQNAFLIDGLDSVSLLDPAFNNPLDPFNVAGHPLSIFLDSALVERLTVYDSNVPARYGGFSGGVIDVETREPKGEFGGEISYRGTRADWTRFHLQEGDEGAPDFEKHDGGVDLNLPLRPGAGVFGSYRILHSRFPSRHLGGSRTQTRRLDQIFLKPVLDLPEGRLALTAAATPYEAEHFYPEVKNSDFTIQGGGYTLGTEYLHFLEQGELKLLAGYQQSWNDREAPANFLNWQATDSRPWGRLLGYGFSREGGFGDIEKTQENIHLEGHWAGDGFNTGKMAHAMEAGVELEHVRGSFERTEDGVLYDGAVIDPDVICGEDTIACIDEEQFFTLREILPRSRAEARVNLADLYLQDEIVFRRWTVRPGVRLSWDDFMENLNVAPRLASAYDLLGDGRTVLVAGINRYYARNLIVYKLREAQRAPTVEYRGLSDFFPGDWISSPFPGAKVPRFSRLQTPYDDEVMAGVDQALLGGRLSLKYVRREGRDQFAREYGTRQEGGLWPFTVTNRGRSRHESWRATWEREWPRHLVSMNVTWQETSTSNETYDVRLDEGEVSEQVWLDGRIVFRDELPRRDYNRPWTANLTYVGRLPYGFSFTNITRYRGGYKAVVPQREVRNAPEGETILNPVTGDLLVEALPVYRTEDLSGGVAFDWKIAWQSPGKRGIVLLLEVENVFDTRLETGTAENAYEIGRQFWAGASYRF